VTHRFECEELVYQERVAWRQLQARNDEVIRAIDSQVDRGVVDRAVGSYHTTRLYFCATRGAGARLSLVQA
jgi:hypothetical protein